MKDYGKLISSKFHEKYDAYVNQMISLTKISDIYIFKYCIYMYWLGASIFLNAFFAEQIAQWVILSKTPNQREQWERTIYYVLT